MPTAAWNLLQKPPLPSWKTAFVWFCFATNSIFAPPVFHCSRARFFPKYLVFIYLRTNQTNGDWCQGMRARVTRRAMEGDVCFVGPPLTKPLFLLHKCVWGHLSGCMKPLTARQSSALFIQLPRVWCNWSFNAIQAGRPVFRTCVQCSSILESPAARPHVLPGIGGPWAVSEAITDFWLAAGKKSTFSEGLQGFYLCDSCSP